MQKSIRWISILSLIIFLHAVIPIQSFAIEKKSDGIFINYSSSKNLVTDLKFYDTNYPKLNQKYNLCSQQVDNANKEIKAGNELLSGCNQDKVDLKTVSKEFEKKYSDSSNKLIDCEASKPSRTTWFTLGAVTTAILTIALGFFIIRK